MTFASQRCFIIYGVVSHISSLKWLIRTLSGSCSYFCFTDEETEAQKNNGLSRLWAQISPCCASRWGDIGVTARVLAPGAILPRKAQNLAGILQGCSRFSYFQPQHTGMLLGCWETCSLVLPVEKPSWLSRPGCKSRSQELPLRTCPKQGTCASILGTSALGFGLFGRLALGKFFSVLLWSRHIVQKAPLTWLSISILWSHHRRGISGPQWRPRVSAHWKFVGVTCWYRLI